VKIKTGNDYVEPFEEAPAAQAPKSISKAQKVQAPAAGYEAEAATAADVAN
jgi:hypothetical protein